ncbi:MAG: phosphoribosylamine--glycine ligase [Ferruginibacter sp.]
MNILLIGSGGREHTLAWKLKQSPLCDLLFVAPGNAGTELCAENIDIAVTAFEEQAQFCLKKKIDMIVVGPEEPLVKGIYDFFKNNPSTAHILVIGPSQKAAQLEGSKAFAKDFMHRHNIPTAAYREFDNTTYKEGIEYINGHSLPIVLKADGLAAGKGVLICSNHVEALAEFELMVQRNKFGTAGHKVVIEEYLQGIELSVFVLTDGKDYVMLPEAKDYKRIGDGDTGLNTGGMGAVSPVPFAGEEFLEKVRTKVIEPTIAGLQKDKLDYCGFIFIGLMNHNSEPCVIEYNCRMGDPETEVVIPRIKNDLVLLLQAAAQKNLSNITVETDQRTAVAIMAVSGGYPGEYQKDLPISGLAELSIEGSILFHAGTKRHGINTLTNGGRVFAVTSFGDTIAEAAEQSLYAMEQVYFEDIYFRSDIGFEFK